MDGVDSLPARRFFAAVWDRLEQEHIPYALHWGKINFNLNEARLEQMYGAVSVKAWIDARNTLLETPALAVFDSSFLKQCGLNKVHGAIV